MRLPDDYHGVWTGLVQDSRRTRPYRCTMELHGGGGTTQYAQVQGPAHGKLEITGDAPVLRESYTGPRGKQYTWHLTLRLNGAHELICHWRGENGGEARAALKRSALG